MKLLFILSLVLLTSAQLSCNRGSLLGRTCSFTDDSSQSCTWRGAAQVWCGRPYLEQSFGSPVFIQRVTFQTSGTATPANAKINIVVSLNRDDGFVDVREWGVVVPEFLSLIPKEGNTFTVTFSKSVPARYVRVILTSLGTGATITITPIFHTCSGASGQRLITWDGDMNMSPVNSLDALDFDWVDGKPAYLDTEQDVIAKSPSALLSTSRAESVIAICQFQILSDDQCPSETYVTKEFSSGTNRFDGANLGGSYFVFNPAVKLCTSKRYCQVMVPKIFNSNGAARAWCQTIFKDQFKINTPVTPVTLFTPHDNANLVRLVKTEASSFYAKNDGVAGLSSVDSFTIGLVVPDIFRGSYPRSVTTKSTSVLLQCRDGYSISTVVAASQISGDSNNWADLDALLSRRLFNGKTITLPVFPPQVPVGCSKIQDRLASVKSTCEGLQSCTVTNSGQLHVAYICVPNAQLREDCVGTPSDVLSSYRLTQATVSVTPVTSQAQGTTFIAPVAVISDVSDPGTELLTVIINSTSAVVTSLAVPRPLGGTVSITGSNAKLVGTRDALNYVLNSVVLTISATCTASITYTVSVYDNGDVNQATATIGTFNQVIQVGGPLITATTPPSVEQGTTLTLAAFTLDGLCNQPFTATFELAKPSNGVFKLSTGASGPTISTSSLQTIQFQPSAQFYGTALYSLQIVSGTNTREFDLQIIVNRKKETPVVVITPVDSCKENTPCQFDVLISDADAVSQDTFQLTASSACASTLQPASATVAQGTTRVTLTFPNRFSVEKNPTTACSLTASAKDKDVLTGTSPPSTFTVAELANDATLTGLQDISCQETSTNVGGFSFVVTDDNDPTADTYLLTVSVLEGTIAYTGSFSAQGSGTAQIAFGALTRAQINSLPSSLIYTPKRNGSPVTQWSVGLYENRGARNVPSQTKNINVQQINDPPTISALNGQSVDAGNPVYFSTPDGKPCFKVSDPDSDRATITVVGKYISSVVGKVNNVQTFVLTGSLDEINEAGANSFWKGDDQWCGTLTVQVTANDVPRPGTSGSSLSDTKTFTHVVNPVSRPHAIAVTPTALIGYGTTTVLRFSVTDTDAASCRPDTYSYQCTATNNDGSGAIAVFSNKQSSISGSALSLTTLNGFLNSLYVSHTGQKVKASFVVSCTVTSSDGTVKSASVTASVTSTAYTDQTNRPPVVQVTAPRTQVNEGSVDIPVQVTISDPDSDVLSSITAKVNFPSAFDEGLTLKGPYSGNVLLADARNISIYNTGFKLVLTYLVTPSTHHFGTFTLSVSAVDQDDTNPLKGDGTSPVITVVNVNDPPTVQFVPIGNDQASTLTVNEDSEKAFGFATMSDIDSTSGRITFASSSLLSFKCNAVMARAQGVTCEASGSWARLTGSIIDVNRASNAGVLIVWSNTKDRFTADTEFLWISAQAADNEWLASDTIRVTTVRIIPQDDPSAIPNAPTSGITTNEDTPVTLYGFVVTDVDSNPYATLTLNGQSGSKSALLNPSGTQWIVGQPVPLGQMTPSALSTLLNQYRYVPGKDYFGTDESIVLKVSSSGNLDQPDATVRIPLRVNAVNDAPVIAVTGEGSCRGNIPSSVSETVLTTQTFSYSIDVSDVDDTNLWVTVTPRSPTSPALNAGWFAFGTLTVSGAGSSDSKRDGSSSVKLDNLPLKTVTVTATWDRRFYGSITFQVTVRDSSNAWATPSCTTTVAVTRVNQAPTISAISDGLIIDQNGPATKVMWNVNDPDIPETLSVQFDLAPLNCGSINQPTISGQTVTQAKDRCSGVSNFITLTPALNYNGTCIITATVTDVAGAKASADVSVTIRFVNFAPTVLAPNRLTLPEDTQAALPSITVDDANFEDKTLSLTFSSLAGVVVVADSGLPTGFTSSVDSNGVLQVTGPKETMGSVTSSLRFSPNANFNGPTSITVVVTDHQSAKNTATISVTVTPVDDPPVLSFFAANSRTATVAEDSSVTLPRLIETGIDGATQKLYTISATSNNGVVTPLTTSCGSSFPVGRVKYTDAVAVIGGAVNGGLRYTPKAHYNGADTVTVTLSIADCTTAALCTTQISIEVTVTPVGDAPQLTYVWPSSFTVDYRVPKIFTDTFAFTDADIPYGDTFALSITCGAIPCGLTTSSGGLYANATSLTAAQLITAASNLQFPAYPTNPPTSITLTVTDSYGLAASKTISISYNPRPPTPPQWSPTLTEASASNMDDTAGCVLPLLFATAPRISNPDQPTQQLTVTFTLPTSYSISPITGCSFAAAVSTTATCAWDATNTYTLRGTASAINAIIAQIRVGIPASGNAVTTFNVPFTILNNTPVSINTVAVIVSFINAPARLNCVTISTDASCTRIRTAEDTNTIANVYTVSNRETSDTLLLRVVSSGSPFILPANCAACSLSTTNGQNPTIEISGTAATLNGVLNTLTLRNPPNGVLTYTLTFSLTDTLATPTPSTASGAIPTQVEVYDIPDLPFWISYPAVLQGDEDAPISFSINANDVDTALLSVTVTALNSVGTFTRGSTGTRTSSLTFSVSNTQIQNEVIVFYPKEDYFTYLESAIQVRVTEGAGPFSGPNGAAGSTAIGTIQLTLNRIMPTVAFQVDGNTAAAISSKEGSSRQLGVVLGSVDGYVELTVTPSCGIIIDNVGSSVGNGGWKITGAAQDVRTAATSYVWAVPVNAIASNLCTTITAVVTDGGKSQTASITSTPIAQCLAADTGLCDDNDPTTLRDRCVGGQCRGYACTQKNVGTPAAPSINRFKRSQDFFVGISFVSRTVSDGKTVFRYTLNAVPNSALGFTFGIGFGDRSSFTIGGLLASRILPTSATAFENCPNTGVRGVRFQPFTGNDVGGSFTVTVDGEVLQGKLPIGIHSNTDYAVGQIDGPVDVCCTDTAVVATVTVAPSPTPISPTTNTIYLCENIRDAIPACPAGQVIRVLSSFYGRRIGSPGDAKCGGPVVLRGNEVCSFDVTPISKTWADKKQGPIPYTSSNWMTGVFNDPCVNTYKYAIITYACEGSRNLDTSSSDIQCPTGETLTIAEAVTRVRRTGSSIQSDSACATTITSQIKSRCDNKARCQFRGDEFGVSCAAWGTGGVTSAEKFITTKYSCSGDASRSAADIVAKGRKLCKAGSAHPYFLELSEERDETPKREAWFDVSRLFSSTGRIGVGWAQDLETGSPQVWKTRDSSSSNLPARNTMSYFSTSVCVDADTILKPTVQCHDQGYVNAYSKNGNIFKFYGQGVAGNLPVVSGCQTIVFEVDCKGNSFKVVWDKDVYADYDIVEPPQLSPTAAKASVTFSYESFRIDTNAIVRSQNNNDLFRDTLLRARATFAAAPVPGYCNLQMSVFQNFNNQGSCPQGSSTNIGWVWTITFFEPVGATWEFRAGMDTGLGFLMYMDGDFMSAKYTDTWWAGNWNLGHYSGSIFLSGPRTHTITVYAAEGCCDGGQEWQFRRASGSWTVMSTTALQNIVDQVGIPASPPVQFDTCSGSEIIVPPAPTPPPSVDVTYGLCQTKTRIDCAPNSDITVSECDNGGAGRQSAQLFCKNGQGIFIASVSFGYTVGEPRCSAPSTTHTTTLLADSARVTSLLSYCHGTNQCNFVIAGIKTLLGWTNVDGRVRLTYRCVAPKATGSTFMRLTPLAVASSPKFEAQQLSRSCATTTLGSGRGNNEVSRNDVTVELLTSFSTPTYSEFRYRVNLLSGSAAPNGLGWGSRTADFLTIGSCGCTGQATVLPIAGDNTVRSALTGDGFSVALGNAKAGKEVIIRYNSLVGIVAGSWSVRTSSGFLNGAVNVPCCDRNECFPNNDPAETFPPTDSRFYKLRFHSYRFTFTNAMVTADSFVNAHKASAQPDGYCSRDLPSHTNFNNNDVCGGPNNNIGWKFDHDFFEPTAQGTWQFQFGIDWGWGGFCYLDDDVFNAAAGTWGTAVLSIFTRSYSNIETQLWWSGSWSNPAVFRTSDFTVSAGRHRLTCYAAENCCDGRQSAQYRRNGGAWRDLSTANLADTVFNSGVVQCDDTCGCNRASCVLNPKCVWNGVLCSPIVPLGTCAYARQLPPNDPTNPFISVTYASRYLVPGQDLWAAGSEGFAARITPLFNAPATAGYCNTKDSSLASIRNSGSCGAPQTSNNIAFKFQVLFFESAGATWGFRFGIDWGRGGVCYLDGERLWIVRPVAGGPDLWWGGGDWSNTNVQTTNGVVLTPGIHNFTCIAAEECCDGNQAFQYRRNSGPWSTVSVAQLATEAAVCEPVNTCNEVDFTDCTSQIVKVKFSSTLAAFNPVTFAATVAAQLGVPVTSINVISAAQSTTSSKSKLGVQSDADGVDVMFRVVGASNETLTDIASKMQESTRLVKEGDQSAVILTTASFMVQPSQTGAFQGSLITVIVNDDGDVIQLTNNGSEGVRVAVIVISVIGVLILWGILMVLIMWRRAKVMVISRDPRLLRKTPVFQDIVKQQIV